MIAEFFRKSQGKEIDLNDPVSTFNVPHQLSSPILINYLGTPRTIRTISYYQALDYKRWLNDEIFKDKIVMVGFDLVAPADVKMADHFQFPLVNVANTQLPGVEAHATVVDTLLNEKYLQSAPLSLELAFFIAFLLIRCHYFMEIQSLDWCCCISWAYAVFRILVNSYFFITTITFLTW